MTNCTIQGCTNLSGKRKGICEKHYIRHYRTGTYDLIPKVYKKAPRKDGYVSISIAGHPLASGHSIYEHRYVLYEHLGESLKECDLCKKPITWKSVHVDHIDCNKSNNKLSNLRPLCNACNTRRNYPPQHTVKGRSAITYNGKTQTALEWVRELSLNISSATVNRRIKAGASFEIALFGDKKTHKNSNATTLKKALHE